jgi:putative component of membrane protein insertase Oxa1/YidC/SpoIIIJ protein YidD
MKLLALRLIEFYKRHVSPRKGFSCAYRCHTGRASCSTLGYRAIRRHGVLRGVGLLRQRLHLCGVAHRRWSPPARPLKAEAGLCDMGCDVPCDLSFPVEVGDALQICDCPCDCGDWGDRSKRRKRDEKYAYIPPARSQ